MKLAELLPFIKVLKMKIDGFANSLYPDEAAHDKPLHLDIHCLNSQYDLARKKACSLMGHHMVVQYQWKSSSHH